MKNVKIETKAKVVICILGFIICMFMSKNFVFTIKDNVKDVNPVMYLFYRAGSFGVTFNFIPFIIFPVLFWGYLLF